MALLPSLLLAALYQYCTLVWLRSDPIEFDFGFWALCSIELTFSAISAFVVHGQTKEFKVINKVIEFQSLLLPTPAWLLVQLAPFKIFENFAKLED